MGKYVSIDFGSRSVKVVALEGSPKRFTLTHFAERDVPSRSEGDDGVEVLVQAIEAMFADMRLPKDRVGVSIPAQDCYFREFYVPFTQPEVIAKIIKNETENYLPSTPIEDLIVDYYPVAVEEGRTKVLVAACPKENVGRIMEVLRRCEIDPPTIGLDITGLYAASRAIGAIDDQTTCVLVDLGAQAMKIGLVEDGRLVHIRTPRVGTDVLVEAKPEASDLGVLEKEVDLSEIDVAQLDLKELEKELIVSLSGFEDRRDVEAGEQEAAANDGRQAALVVRMVRETVRTLAGRRLKSQPSKILVAGGGSVLPNLNQDLAEKLQIEVVPVDVLGSVKHNLNGIDPAEFGHSVPVGVGVGLRQMGYPSADFDFRKEEFRFTRKFDQVRGVLVVAVCGLFCVALSLCYLVKGRTAQLGKINDDYVQAAGKPFGMVFPQTVEGQAQAKKVWNEKVRQAPPARRLQNILDAMMAQMGERGSDKPQDLSALVVWRELTRQIREATGGLNEPGKGGRLTHFFIDYVEYREKSLTIKGEIDNPGERAQFLEAITRSPYLPRYRWNGAIENKTPAPFSVTYEVVVPEEEE